MAAGNKAPTLYNDAKFREVIPSLSLAEYLKIEYLSKGVWFKMLSKRGNSYNCECCGVDNIGPTPVIEHVRGKKHRFALQAAEQLYHPSYTQPKKVNANAPARTPILDAYNAAAGVSVAAKITKAPAGITVPPKGNKAAPIKSNVQAQKPAGQQKAAGPQQKQLKQQPKPGAVKKPNTTNKPEPPQTVATPKTNAAAAKSGEPVPEQNKEKIEKTTADSGVKQEVTKQPEENKIAANGNVTKKDEKTDSNVLEVVVLDDDDDVTVQGPTPKIPEGQAISTISTATAKPQRPPRRNANVPPQVQQKSAPEVKPVDTLPPGTEGNEGDTTITTNKKVINPAAVLAKTADQNDENTPRYQQNRVIIPTVDRTKKKSTPVQNKDEVDDVTQPSFSTKNFTAKTTSEIEGIIGVEYVVKILKVYNDPEPFYECCLCEVVMDGIGMQTHLLGYNHRYKYLEKHFPTCFNQYKEHIGNIQVMGIILDRIAKAVEAHHGRELPYECLSGEFRSNRHGVMTTVYSFRHASEYSGPSFTNVVDTKQVDEFYKKKNIYLPPRPDPKRKPTFDTRSGGAPVAKRSKVERPAGRSGGGGTRGGSRGSGAVSGRRPYRDEVENNTIDDAVHKQMVEEFLQNTRGRSRSPGGGRRRRHRTRSRSRSRSPHRSSRRRIQRRSVSPLREGDVWQAYRHLVDRSKVELDQMYRDYRKDPEKHPLYDEEWRKFWKHRKDQMTREGLDHKNYDFQPEWVRYFAVRIEELYDEAVEDIKINCRRRLILPMTNDELEDRRYHLKKVQEEEEPIVVMKSKPESDYIEMSNKTSVVSVLRLLTALEDYLGSLGPRVVDLLSKALLVEKSNPREINEIVLNLENCTILETAMEKLKGVLIAGLLEGPKVRAFNNVITETEKILRMAYKMRQRNPQPVPQPVPAPKNQLDYQQQKSSYLGAGSSFMQQQSHSMGGSNNGGSNTAGAAASLLSQIDKKELAAKLAAALTAQGKTDFNPEQLQQLIAVYSLIDKKKRDSAAAADKQKMTLSDTLTALLNPSEKSGGGGMSGSLTQQSSGGRIGGNYSNNSNDRLGGPGPLSNSSITNFVSMLNRDNLSTGGSGNSGDTQMWQNLQNIQNSLRMQNSGGFGNNSMGSGGTGGVGGGGGGAGSGYMDNMSSNTNFSRGGFGGGSVSGTGVGGGGFNLGHNSSMNFSRSGSSGGGGRISGDNDGFQRNFQNMSDNNSGFSRDESDDMHVGGGGRGGRDNMLGGRGGDNMLGGRGADNMLGGRGADNMIGGRGGDNMLGGRGGGGGGGGGVRGLSGTFSSGGLGGNVGGGGGGMGGGGGGLGGGSGGMGGGSGGMGGGGGNFSRGGGGMRGGNNSGFSRGGNDNFLVGGGRNSFGGSGSESGGGGFGGNFTGSGLNSYPSAGGLGGNNNYQRGSGGMGGGMDVGGGTSGGGSGGMGSNSGGMGGGGGNFGRGGGNSTNYANPMNNNSNFNKNSGRNEGSGPVFGSNQRMGGNQSNQQPMARNALGGPSMGSNSNNSQAGRGGSNWRNQ